MLSYILHRHFDSALMLIAHLRPLQYHALIDDSESEVGELAGE